MFKKGNLPTTIFILVLIVLIALAVFSSIKKDDAKPATTATSEEVAFDMKKQPIYGSEDAPISMTIFYDYQCPHCKQWEEETFPVLKEGIFDKKVANIRFVNYSFMNGSSDYLAMAGELVYDKNPSQFVAFHEELFKNQTNLSTTKTIDLTAKYSGISKEEVTNLLTNAKYKGNIDSDKKEGTRLGVSGTPSLFIDGKRVENAYDLKEIQDTVNKKLKTLQQAEKTTKTEEDTK